MSHRQPNYCSLRLLGSNYNVWDWSSDNSRVSCECPLTDTQIWFCQIVIHRGRIDEPAVVKQIISLIDKADGRFSRKSPGSTDQSFSRSKLNIVPPGISQLEELPLFTSSSQKQTWYSSGAFPHKSQYQSFCVTKWGNYPRAAGECMFSKSLISRRYYMFRLW